MNSGLLREKAFGSIYTVKAGAVAQKDLFERWRFFFFYKPEEANSSWLTAAFCTVCAACILSTWFYSPFFHFRVYLYFCLGRFSISLLPPCTLEKPFLHGQRGVFWDLKPGFLVSKVKSDLTLGMTNMTKARHVTSSKWSLLSAKSAWKYHEACSVQGIASSGFLFIMTFQIKTKRFFKHKMLAWL